MQKTMRIDLDKDTRVMLLHAVKDGSIESGDLKRILNGHGISPYYSKDEVLQELERLYMLNHADVCERLRRLGLCELCRDAVQFDCVRTQ